MVVEAHGLVILPLGGKVEDAVDRDAHLDAGAPAFEVAVRRTVLEKRQVAGERHKRGQMRPRRIPEKGEPAAVEPEVFCLGANELNGGPNVVDGCRIGG
ncbi:hypothetical protein ABIA20_002788 [Sinorhizobium fredii]